MAKPRALLLLLWSSWMAGGVGTQLDGHVRDTVCSDCIRRETARSEWATIRGSEGGPRRELRHLLAPNNISPDGSGLQFRREPETKSDEEEDDGKDDDEEAIRKRQSPLPVPPGNDDGDDDDDGDIDTDSLISSASASVFTKVSTSVSASVSASVSTSVSDSVATSVSADFAVSIGSLSASIASLTSAPTQPAGETITITITAPPTTTDASVATTADSATTTESTSSSIVVSVIDAASAISSIQASASQAVEDAKASASRSAQSAIDTATNTAMAANKNPTEKASMNVEPQNSGLTPGQIAGLVIAMMIVASVLSGFGTFFILRRRQRQQPQQHEEAPSKYGGGDVAMGGPAGGRRSPMSSIRRFVSAAAAAGHGRSATQGSGFIPDMKQRMPPAPPAAEHPAMSRAARPSGGDDLVSPVTPLDSDGEFSEPEDENDASQITAAGGRPAPGRYSPDPEELSRQKSHRAVLMRIASNGSEEALVREPVGPLSMNPVIQRRAPQPQNDPRDDDDEDDRSLPVPLDAGADGSSSNSSFQVQAPIPRRPVDYGSLERSMARRP
ncbi:hypothetical protein GGR52DRAFT_584435 [Hypoxylon sp. FL1284]|nr:hypothetical protein GGR52DRAFT_584435 [Hypoxylon sp. FL1284]